MLTRAALLVFASMAVLVALAGASSGSPGGEVLAGADRRSLVVVLCAAVLASIAATVVGDRLWSDRTSRAEQLVRLTRRLHHADTRAGFAAAVTTHFVEEFGARSVIVATSDDGRVVAVVHDLGETSVEGWAAAHDPIISNTVEVVDRLPLPDHRAKVERFDRALVRTHLPRSVRYVTAPLNVSGSARGVVVVDLPPGRPARAMVDGVDRAAALAALALQRFELLEEVQWLALHDPLTGLRNRHQFELELERELASVERRGGSCAVLVLDVDHFKRINDDFGHAVGDQVLRRLGEILQQCLRKEDLVARFGGEEFIVVLPGHTTEAAVEVAERLRTTVPARLQGDWGTVTVSVGVATYPVHGHTSDLLLTAADSAMYEAKRAGRNSVIVFRGGSTASAARRISSTPGR